MRRGRRLQNLWTDYSWFIILFLGISSLILGYVGFWKNGLALGTERTILDNLYLTLGLISLNSGSVPAPVSWELQVARFAVPAVTAYTAFLAFTTIFIQQTDRVRLLFIREHVVICGLGRKGFRLASQFLAGNYPVVVVEIDEGNEYIESIRSAGAVVIQGDAGDLELLSKLKLEKAHSLVAVVGDDGKNAEIAVQAEKISRSRASGCLTCIIHISESRLWRLLREKELQTQGHPHFRLELFNIYDRGAHLLVQGNPPWQTLVDGIAPRVLVIGLGKMGQRVVLEVARGWQLLDPPPEAKLDLTVIDREATKKLEALSIQNPRLEKLGSYTPLDLDLESGEFDRIAERFLEGAVCQLDMVYVCLDEETFCLQTGLRLNHQLRKYRIPIVLRMVESGGLARLIENGSSAGDGFGNLRVFDLLDQTCTAEMLQGGTHEILARNLHGVYLEGLRRRGQDAGENISLAPWEELPEGLKEDNRQLADRIPVMLAAAGYRIAPLTNWDAENLQFQEEEPGDQVELMAQMEHQSWCERKKQDGWQFGREKDLKKKTNPSLVPWEELPAEEQEKNKQFIRGLPRLLVRAGFQVERQ
jgi:hypothetical protein